LLEAAVRRLPADASLARTDEARRDHPVLERPFHLVLPRHRPRVRDRRGRGARARRRGLGQAALAAGPRRYRARLAPRQITGGRRLRSCGLSSAAARPRLPDAALGAPSVDAGLARAGGSDPGERAALSDSDTVAVLRVRASDPACARELRGPAQ